jgi:hypothetical protein
MQNQILTLITSNEYIKSVTRKQVLKLKEECESEHKRVLAAFDVLLLACTDSKTQDKPLKVQSDLLHGKSIFELVGEAVRFQDDSFTLNDIVNAIQNKLGVQIKRGAVATALHRLKASETIKVTREKRGKEPALYEFILRAPETRKTA